MGLPHAGQNGVRPASDAAACAAVVSILDEDTGRVKVNPTPESSPDLRNTQFAQIHRHWSGGQAVRRYGVVLDGHWNGTLHRVGDGAVLDRPVDDCPVLRAVVVGRSGTDLHGIARAERAGRDAAIADAHDAPI